MKTTSTLLKANQLNTAIAAGYTPTFYTYKTRTSDQRFLVREVIAVWCNILQDYELTVKVENEAGALVEQPLSFDDAHSLVKGARNAGYIR